MDNLRFETSKLKIPFYCIKNEIIDDYCIFVNLTQLFYQFSILSTREPPPQHFLAFYSHIFIEDFISKYNFHLLYSLVFLTIKDRMIEKKARLDSIISSSILSIILPSIPSFIISSSVICLYFLFLVSFFSNLVFSFLKSFPTFLFSLSGERQGK